MSQFFQQLGLRGPVAGHRDGAGEAVFWAVFVACGTFLLAAAFVTLVAQPTIDSVDGPTHHSIGLSLAQEFRYSGGAYPYPLYPIYLAVVYALGGGFNTVFLVQGALLALTAGLGYWLARQIAGHRTGILAATLIALDASLLGNVGLIATENLQAPLLLLAAIVSILALQRSEYRFHMGSGVLWGLLTLAKPATLLWPLFLLPVYILAFGLRGWRLWLALSLAFVLTLSPWLVRNQLAPDATTTGQFHLPFAQGYPTLLIHVVDEGEARFNMEHLEPKLKAAAAEAAALGIERDSIQFDIYALRLLWERIAHSPNAYLGHLWDNFTYFWTEPAVVWTDSSYNHRNPKGYRQVPGFAEHAALHGVFAVMALLSLLVLWQKRPHVAWFITALALYYAGFHTMFVVLPRFNVPVMPLVLVGAAALPALVFNTVEEWLVNRRVLGNVLLAAVAVALVSGSAVQILLHRPDYVQEGSFETSRAQEVWVYEGEVLGRPTSPLEVEPNRGKDGFRSAMLSINYHERGREKRFKQDIPVWFDTSYRLKFSYLFVEEDAGLTRLYVEALEWDIFTQDWTRVRKEFQPRVSHMWAEGELAFAVSETARAVTVVFGVLSEQGTVLIDDVRLELAVPARELLERPFLLLAISETNPNNFLELEKWVETQPQEKRSSLLANPDAALASGWRRGEAVLRWVAPIVGVGVLLFWAVTSLLCVRLRLAERIVRTKLLRAGVFAAIVLAVLVQAATCYLLLFSDPL